MYDYKANVVRVIDGDTIEVNIDLGLWTWKHNERIRLLGVNTPEKFGVKKWLDKDKGIMTEEYLKGLAASEFTENWLKENAIDGEIMIRTFKNDKEGKYGRLLATVYTLNIDESLNKALLESGHAVAFE